MLLFLDTIVLLAAPSLPGPGPGNDATYQNQIPFRDRLASNTLLHSDQ
jgi:hypothetical protein